jgi:hypothetical protein
MPFNGSGGFVPLPAPIFPAVAGTTIFSSYYNSQLNDVFTGFGLCVTRDGQSPATANLPMGGFKHTGASDATGTGQYLVWGQAGSVGTMPFALGAAATPSITFVGDLNTGLWSPGADVLAASTGGTERLRVDSVGNVGIGMSAAAGVKLDVNGATRSLTMLLSNGAGVPALGTTPELYSPSSGVLAVATNAGERLSIGATGHVLPGNNGGQNLGAVGSRWATVFGTSFSDGADALLDSTTTTVRVGAGASWTALGLYSSGLERMRIDTAGNAIVGATSALFSSAGRGNVTINGSTDSILAFGSAGAAAAYIYARATRLEFNVEGSREMSFNTGGVERMRIDTSGHITPGVTNTQTLGSAGLRWSVVNSVLGNFSGAITASGGVTGNLTGNVTGALTGNASTATALATSRNINGVAFNGTADITVTAAAGTLTGATLAAGVLASSLTSVGTLTSLAVTGLATHAAGVTVGNSAVAGVTVFDWYEEGTFVPTLTFGGAAVGMTYATQVGEFTRQGNKVYFSLTILLSAKGSSVGGAVIGGLPYSPGVANMRFNLPCTGLTLAGMSSALVAYLNPLSPSIQLRHITTLATGFTTGLTEANLTDTALVSVTGWYTV